jgi:hypothetical protein
MSDLIIDRISEEQFLAVYNKHLPNKWTKIFFRYFSVNTVKEDKWLSRVFTVLLLIMFGLAYVGTVLGLRHTIVGIPTFILLGLLTTIGIFGFGALFMNNARIRKIRKELRVTKEEYDILKDLYLES